MRSSARRLGASSFLAAILLTGGLAAPAAAVTYSATVTQSAPTPLRAGSPQVVTATVTVDGAAVPDGTLVNFSVTRNPGEFVVAEDDILTSAGIGNAAYRLPNNDGYWLADAAGNVLAYGSAPDLGGLPAVYGIMDWVVGIASTKTGNGYWVATLDGKVYPFGDAGEGVIDHGPFEDDWAVGLVSAREGDPAVGSYRLVTARGRTLPSSAALNNTTTTSPLFDDAPVLGAVGNKTGDGYWVFNGNGRVAAFGLNAGFYGDLGANNLNHMITAMAPTPFGTGYWLLAEDGSMYVFGSAKFLGTAQPGDPNGFYTVILPSATGDGYRVGTYQGRVHNFGDAIDYGSLWNVPTRDGKAVFGYTSLRPGSTTVTALGPSSLTGSVAIGSVETTWTPADGYWMLGSDGAVYPFGGAVNLGDAKQHLAGRQAVDLEPTPDYGGYWIVDDGGRVFGFGNAKTTPGNVDAGALRPGEKVTSLSSTPTGAGYWIFTSQGRVFAKGDATHFGDMGGTPLNGPVLDSIPTPTGQGYYMVGSDGGIFAFGDAAFAGSMGDKKLNAPVQSLVPDPDGTGYWLVASDGGIFAFDAGFHGSMGATKLNKPVTGMVAFGDAYLMVGEDGGIFNFSDRPFYGSLGGNPPASPIVSVAILDPFGV
jgi:hypothetical protein